MQEALQLTAAGSLIAIAAGCLISLASMAPQTVEMSADDTAKTCHTKICLIAFF